MRVRAATPADAAAIAALWNAMIRDTLATFTTVEKSQTDLAALITEHPTAFWVVEDGSVQGFATFGPFRPGPGYAATAEHTIVLGDSAQGRGQGRALMAQLENAARAQGIHVLVAAISSANPGAVTFHAALGFAETARMPEVGRKNGQWLDLILMQKSF